MYKPYIRRRSRMKRMMVYLNDLQYADIAKVAKDLEIPFAEALRRVIDDGLQAPTTADHSDRKKTCVAT